MSDELEPVAASARPTTIGRFQVLHTLGAGGMGVVYLAVDPSLGRKVAIKLLHAERAHNEQARARLQREARALALVSHPNVVVVHEVGLYDDQVYLVMEHVAGVTLQAWTRAHLGDWRAIVAQYRAAGEGLAAAHRAGIIHRDFKPANVLVDEDGRPRVLDFGLASPGVEPPAKDVPWDALGGVDLTKTGVLMGTPAYMAPEQFMGATLDARTDQFAFCVALWEALFEEHPFGGDDLATLCNRVVVGQRRRPPERTPVPRSVVAALVQGLATDPRQRFASMPELLQALTEPRPRRMGGWIAGSVAVLAAGVVAAWMVRSPEPSAPLPPSVARDPNSPEAIATAAEPEPVWPTLTSRLLTRTTGLGVSWSSAATAEGTIVYASTRAAGGGPEWWSLSASAADPERLALPMTAAGIVHPGPAGTYWIVEYDRVDRVDAEGKVEHVVDRGQPPAGAVNDSWLSPDGRLMAISSGSGVLVWDLGRPSTAPVRVELGANILGLAWSPDSRSIAVTVILGQEGSVRIEVFGVDGNLRSSTPWPQAAMGGHPLRGLGWLPSGLVALVFDDSSAWVQCMTLGETGIVRQRRSAAMKTSHHTAILSARDPHTLLLAWADVQEQLIVLERIGERVRPPGLPLAPSSETADPVWLSETTLAFLAAKPRGALVSVEVDDLAPIETWATGPFEWASGDGAGGIVAWRADGTAQHWVEGAPSPRTLQLPGVGATNPFLQCRSPRDCSMALANTIFAVDLEQSQVRRQFLCPVDALCDGRRWARSPDGRELLVVDHRQHALLRLHARTGEPMGEPFVGPPWLMIQSVEQTSRGELWVTGVVQGRPPEGFTNDPFVVMRRGEGDEALRLMWSSERTWLSQARPSPSGGHIAASGLTFHAELMALELGSLCEGSP